MRQRVRIVLEAASDAFRLDPGPPVQHVSPLALAIAHYNAVAADFDLQNAPLPEERLSELANELPERYVTDRNRELILRLERAPIDLDFLEQWSKRQQETEALVDCDSAAGKHHHRRAAWTSRIVSITASAAASMASIVIRLLGGK